MLPSKFLKKEDVGKGVLVTVGDVYHVNVALDGADEELKWAMTFPELDKPWVLNSTNLNIMKGIFDSEHSEDWKGKQVVLYHDPSITFAGKPVGGIRVRAPKDPKDDVPF
jgi:hypothetical protein